MNKVKITFINNTGGGFSGEMELDEGTTIETFFKNNFGDDTSFGDFGITINRLNCAPSRVLVEGDSVTIVPGKYSGA